MPNGTHTPDERWRCRVDGRSWPDDDPLAQHELQRDYRHDPGALLLYLALHTTQAARACPTMHEMFISQQFYGWLADRVAWQPEPSGLIVPNRRLR